MRTQAKTAASHPIATFFPIVWPGIGIWIYALGTGISRTIRIALDRMCNESCQKEIVLRWKERPEKDVCLGARTWLCEVISVCPADNCPKECLDICLALLIFNYVPGSGLCLCINCRQRKLNPQTRSGTIVNLHLCTRTSGSCMGIEIGIGNG